MEDEVNIETNAREGHGKNGTGGEVVVYLVTFANLTTTSIQPYLYITLYGMISGPHMFTALSVDFQLALDLSVVQSL